MPPYWKCSRCGSEHTFDELQDTWEANVSGGNDIQSFRRRLSLEEDYETVECDPGNSCVVQQTYVFRCPDCSYKELYTYGEN